MNYGNTENYWLQWFLLQVSCYVFSVLVCLSSFGGNDLLRDLNSLMELREVIGFCFFILCEDGNDDFQAFYM